MRPLRHVVIASMLLLASCAAGDDAGPAAPGAATGGATNGGTATNGGSGGGSGGGGSGGGSGSGGGGSARYDDGGNVGSMARTYLKASPASKLHIEIDYQDGLRPSASAVGHSRSTLDDVTDKSSIAVTQNGGLPAKDSWTLADLKALEAEHRQRRSSGDTVTMWIAYVGGSYAENDGALGVAYSATSAVIFRERIDDATTAIVNASAIERSVLLHEVGHLLALVNLGYTSKHDHEDPEHKHHSSNDESVMYWAVEDVSLRNLLRGGPPDTFDDADLADLRMLKNS